MGNITFKCPNCANALEVDASWANKKGECPYCQSKFIIPNAVSLSTASKITKCPKCMNDIEVDVNWVGKKIECPHCQARFIVPSKESIASLNGSTPKPRMLWAGLNGLYILFSMSLLGNLLEMDIVNNAGAIGLACLLLWGVYRMQQGSNKARITITCTLVFLNIVWMGLSFAKTWIGIVFMLLFDLPVVFLWLPQCNAWFKAQKRIQEQNGMSQTSH